MDTDGLLLGILVHAADIQDADGLGDLLKRLKPLYIWLRAVFTDGIYNRLAALLACYPGGRKVARLVRPMAPAVQGLRGAARGLRGNGHPGRDPPNAPPPRPNSIAGDYPPHDFQNGL